jgi:DNA primase
VTVTFASPSAVQGAERRNDRDEILSLVDLMAMVEARSPGGKIRAHPGTFTCPCPGHNDSTPSVNVSIRNGEWRWRCFGCGAGGTALDLLTATGEARDLAEAFDILRRQVGLERGGERVVVRPPVVRVPALPVPDPPEVAGHHDALVDFCAERGWSPDVGSAWGLRPVIDQRGQHRIRFPFVAGGKEQWYQDRATGAATPKYLAPSRPNAAPFGIDRVDELVDGDLVFLTEGPADAVSLSAGWPDRAADLPVVAVPGTTAWKAPWAKVFAGLVVYVIGDNDEAGRKFRIVLDESLSAAGATVRHLVVPPPHGDLGDWYAADPHAFPRSFVAAQSAAEHDLEVAA